MKIVVVYHNNVHTESKYNFRFSEEFSTLFDATESVALTMWENPHNFPLPFDYEIIDNETGEIFSCGEVWKV